MPHYRPETNHQPSDDDTESLETDGSFVINSNNWHGGPRTLGRTPFQAFAAWIWDILFTLAPLCFFVLAVLAQGLDEKPKSDYGQRIINLTRLSPTIYPIIFAAVASRFFKSIASWRLEKQGGITLGTLEQVFGSQSLAGAFERLLFVRSHLLFGVLTLLIWGLSPLGGQSAVRLLYPGLRSLNTTGPVFYRHPRYQFSQFNSGATRQLVGINMLYTSSLLASNQQRTSPVDLWELPKIPQWPKELEDNVERDINQDALADGHGFYASFLGVHLRGLGMVSEGAQYGLTVETFYYDIDCISLKTGIPRNESSAYFSDPKFNLEALIGVDAEQYSSFAATIDVPRPAADSDLYTNTLSLDDIPPATMLYATLDRNSTGSYWGKFALFNCTIRPVNVDTSFKCNSSVESTNCWATTQKRVNNRYTSNNFSSLIGVEWPGRRDNLIRNWRIAEGELDNYGMSLTDKYLSGELYPSMYKQVLRNWADVPLDTLSKRLTTAFNTYFEASLNPANHTRVSFRTEPEPFEIVPETSGTIVDYLNQTEAVATVRYPVYRADRRWVLILIMSTAVLEALAVAGAVLQLFIKGPDILGFASSLTRENPYADLSLGGSALDGPARARALRNLHVQLSDVHPQGQVGYIAFTAAASAVDKLAQDDDGSWRRLRRRRAYL